MKKTDLEGDRPSRPTDAVRVWDTVVRVGHWALVLLFVVAYLSGEEESLLHVYAGYGVLGIVVFRILWGVVGTRHARFTDFVYGRAETLRYLKSILALRPIHYLGHNPLGGWMIVALLISLLAVNWSGMELYGVQGHGPLAGGAATLLAPAHADDDEAGSERESVWEEIHEVLANLAVVLVLLHIAGVVSSSLVHRENLVRAMITGNKRARDG